MSAGLPLRLKYVCGQYGRVLVAALVVASAFAFAGAAAGATDTPDPQRTTVQTDQQAVSTSLTATATVTGNTTLYDQGETVSDRPVYLLSAAPNLTLRVGTNVPTDQDVVVTQDVVLELSAARDEAVFWSERRELASTTRRVTDGRSRTTVTLDVRRLARERLAAVKAAADEVGIVRVRILVNASYDTGTYAGQVNLSSPVSVSGRAYEFDTPQVVERNHSTTVARPVNASVATAAVEFPGTEASLPSRSLWWVVAGIGALVLAVFVRTVDRRIEDFETFEKYYESVRYADWISRGKLPDSGEYARVPVETLLDLVDVAIDSEKRVIHDQAQDVYAVVDDGVMYEFRDAETSGRMYEFGLAPIDETTATLEQELQEAEAAASNGEEGEPTESWRD
jgi:hypothetical protein